jgi:hypothetical protein
MVLTVRLNGFKLSMHENAYLSLQWLQTALYNEARLVESL